MELLLDEMVMEIACCAQCAGDVDAMALTCKSWKRALCTHKRAIWALFKARHFPDNILYYPPRISATKPYASSLSVLATWMAFGWYHFWDQPLYDIQMVLDFTGHCRFCMIPNTDVVFPEVFENHVLVSYPVAWDRGREDRAKNMKGVFARFLRNVDPSVTVRMYFYVNAKEAHGYAMNWFVQEHPLMTGVIEHPD